MASAVSWYNANAEGVAAQYESADPEALHEWMADLMPQVPANALDVGSGSGRDAAWLASKGYEVVAAEPSAAMRRIAGRLHGDAPVRWLADGLPELRQTIRTGISFDLILASAVWMHVHPQERQRAFRKLVNLLNPGALIAFSARQGSSDDDRRFHPVGAAEFEQLARGHGAYVERLQQQPDRLGRADVQWIHCAIRLPDESTGALPLLRHMILNDNKSSTYKLGLLRCLCRVADGTAGLAHRLDDELVSVPLGVVALTWIRLYKPLLERDFPQSRQNVRFGERLRFAKDAFKRLCSGSDLDLRVGMRLSGQRAAVLHDALRDAAETIKRMPAHHLTLQDGKPVFPVEWRTSRRPSGSVVIDAAYLWSFGKMLVPWRIWQAMQRYSVWIEPAIVEEWVRLMLAYAARQGRALDRERIAPAMIWDDPTTRDVRLPRERAEGLLDAGQLYCVWTGRPLSMASLDVDHCMPWSVWPCGDLWNLMPAHRQVNQNKKGAKLPSAPLMRSCQDRLMTWRDSAYRSSDGGLDRRFVLEAESTLPGLGEAAPCLDTVFEAVLSQRARLRQNQRVPEWLG